MTAWKSAVRTLLLKTSTHSRVSPEMNERVYVCGRRQQHVVPPLIVADGETAILVHPVDKLNE